MDAIITPRSLDDIRAEFTDRARILDGLPDDEAQAAGDAAAEGHRHAMAAVFLAIS